MKKVLILPGWVRSLKLYRNRGDNFDICIGKLNEKSISADYVIGLSLGALTILQGVKRIKGKIILVNPPLPKRNILAWSIHWLDFFVHEGVLFRRTTFIKNPIQFALELLNAIKLLSIDFSEALIISKARG